MSDIKYKTFKVMLVPNNKQRTKLFQYAGTARFAYNWALEREQTYYKEKEGFKSDCELRKEFTLLKKEDEYSWLNDVSNNVSKQAIKDAVNAFKKFFKKISGYPRYKVRGKSKESFYQDTDKIQFTETHVKIEGFAESKRKNRQVLNWVRLAEHNRIPLGVKYYNPRITFDGLNWWISVSIEVSSNIGRIKPFNDCLGIDVGIKDLAICSDGDIYKNINKIRRVRYLEKQRKRVQRSISRKISKNIKSHYKDENGYLHPIYIRSFKECKNFQRSRRELKKIAHRISNIQEDYLNQVINNIIKKNFANICIEDLNVKGMMKNRHLSKAIQNQGLYKFKIKLLYKAESKGIKVVEADRFFPSSKKCIKCGNIKKDLKLKDRVYHCSICGNTIDRDYQASLNLRQYGLEHLH